MKPMLEAVAAKVRADRSWPDLPVFEALLRVAGGTREEVMSMTRSYRKALFSGHWPEEGEPVSAEEKLMASLRSFSLGNN